MFAVLGSVSRELAKGDLTVAVVRREIFPNRKIRRPCHRVPDDGCRAKRSGDQEPPQADLRGWPVARGCDGRLATPRRSPSPRCPQNFPRSDEFL
jgi:hypothetical protein